VKKGSLQTAPALSDNDVVPLGGYRIGGKPQACGDGGFAEAQRSVMIIDWSIIFGRFYENKELK